MMKKIYYKKFVFFLIRITCIFIILDTLLNILTSNYGGEINLSYFIDYGFKTIFSLDYSGSKNLNLFKFLTSLSIFMLIEIDSIVYTMDLSEGFKDIIKFHSKSKLEYFFKIIRVSSNILMRDLIYWIITFVMTIYIFRTVKIEGVYEYITLLAFLFVNSLYTVFLYVICGNSMMTIFFYSSKLLVYSMFFEYEIFLIFIILVLLCFYVKFSGKLEELYENYSKKRN